MNLPSSTKTEHRAINALERIIDEHDTMEHQFNGNDKEMSWDGYIWLYKCNDGKQSKDNFDARVPVQIKGHNDNKGRYLGKSKAEIYYAWGNPRHPLYLKGDSKFQWFPVFDYACECRDGDIW